VAGDGAAGAAAEAGDIQGRGAVEVEGGVAEVGADVHEAAGGVAAHHAGLGDAEADVGDGAEKAFHEVDFGHFEGEEGGGEFAVGADVLGDVEGEGAFAHAGAGGDDDELAAVEAVGHAVEVDEAGGEAEDLAAVFVVGFDAGEGFVDGVGALDEADFFAVAAEFEKGFFDGVEDVVGGVLEVAGLGDEFAAEVLGLTAAPVVADLLGPMLKGAEDAGGAAPLGGDVTGAAFEFVEMTGLTEGFGEGDEVDGLAAGAHFFQGEPGGFVGGDEEPVFVDEVDGEVEGVGAVVDDAADDGGFGFVGPKRDLGVVRGHGGKRGSWQLAVGRDWRFEI
jgi:hypothetical protein